MKARSYGYIPLIAFQAYLTLGVYLFFEGPWDWPVEHPFLLFVYLASAQIAIVIGYVLGLKSAKLDLLPGYRPPLRLCPNPNLIKKLSLISLAAVIPTSLARTGALIPNVIAGISEGGEAYRNAIELAASGGAAQLFEYVRIFLALPLNALFPLAVVRWGTLSVRMKSIVVVAIAANISIYLATGVHKGLADFVILFPWLYYIGMLRGENRVFGKYVTIIVATSAIFLVFVSVFTTDVAKRLGSGAESSVINLGDGTLLYSSRSPMFDSYIGREYELGYALLSSYMCQGYYGLALSFDVQWRPTFGFGSSTFLARTADRLFSTDYFSNNALPNLVEESFGWTAGIRWSSVYPHLASDFGYTGALFIVGFFGYLLSRSWVNCIAYCENYSVLVFFLCCMFFYYTPANNQLFQSPESFVFSVSSIILFLRNLRRRRALVRN